MCSLEAGWGINIMMQQATFHNMPMLDLMYLLGLFRCHKATIDQHLEVMAH